MKFTYEIILNTSNSPSGNLLEHTHNSDKEFNIIRICNYVLNAFNERCERTMNRLKEDDVIGTISINLPGLTKDELRISFDNIEELEGVLLLALYPAIKEKTGTKIDIDVPYDELWTSVSKKFKLPKYLTLDVYIKLVESYKNNSLKHSDPFIKAINKMAPGADITYKEFADCLIDIADFLTVQYQKEGFLIQEDAAMYEVIKSWKERQGYSKAVHNISTTPVKLLIKAGDNNLIIDVSKYSNLKEAKDSIKVEIDNSLKNDILSDTMFLMDFKGSTYAVTYNPKDTSRIASKIEEGLQTLLSDYF